MASNEFKVVSGAHQGAAFTVTDTLLVIGADASSDIYLSDAGLAPRHAAVIAQGSGVSIRRLDGPVTVNGEALAASAQVTLTSGAEIILGDSGVQLHLAGPAPAHEPKKRRAHAGKNTSRAVAGFVLIALAASGAFLSSQKLRAARPEKEPPAVVAMPANPALSDAELIEQIRDVFRINGYDAKVTSLGNGRVRIENLDENHGRVQQAAAQVRSDVPQLASLSFARLSDAKPPEQAPLYAYNSVDRMSVRVDGTTAFLASTDGGRYFVGSVLPSGYIVRHITPEAVQVDRDGQIAWFRF
jgi:Inner membrane component of T3SS, cytoplasmic domain